MDPGEREWRLIGEEVWDGPTNMALDEVAAATAAAGGQRTARVYRWDPSTLSLGYNQDPDSVDWAFCEREGVTVTRRPTGGGAIYHDTYGDVSYTLVAPADELPGDLLDSYALLTTPVLEALDRMGVDAGFAAEERPAIHEPACYLRAMHPAHDVVAGGRKISGNAQYRRKDAVIQHGSVKYDLRPARHLDCFAAPGVGPSTFRERVTCIREEAGISRSAAVAALEDALADWAGAEVASWTPEEVAAARQRADEKFAGAAWTRDREAPISR